MKNKMKPAKDYFRDDEATHEWLDSMKKSTRATYQTNWKYFLEFTGMTGDRILEERKEDKNYAWEKKVLEFKGWMIERKGQAEKTAATAAATARSFFSFHRSPLMFRTGEKRRLKEAKTKHEDYRFSRENLQKMADVADLKEKYVVVAGKSFGLRAGDFLALKRGDLEAYFDREVPISIGEYDTQKEGVPAYPFIDRDALPVIKLMVEKMNREGQTNPNERILDYKNSIELSRVVRRVTERAGIKIGNKRVRFHCLRKFLTDRLSSVMSESKWKQIIGKTIDEGAYVSPDTLRKDYARAMPETCFKTPEGAPEQAALMVLKDMARTLGLNPIEIFKRKQKDGVLSTEERRLALLESISLSRKRLKKETQHNGGNCNSHAIITEEQLLSYLDDGWEIVRELSNGNIVVRRVTV